MPNPYRRALDGIGAGDPFPVACGPVEISTAVALVGLAKAAGWCGARVLVVTARSEGGVPRMAGDVLVQPAQTMAADRGSAAATLPMGFPFEGGFFVLCEVMARKLKDRLGVSAGAMRARLSEPRYRLPGRGGPVPRARQGRDDRPEPTRPADAFLERGWSDAIAHARAFLALPQYWAWRLSGVMAFEVTSLAAQSHLWSALDRRPATIMAEYGRGRVPARPPRAAPRGRRAPILPEGGWVRMLERMRPMSDGRAPDLAGVAAALLRLRGAT